MNHFWASLPVRCYWGVPRIEQNAMPAAAESRQHRLLEGNPGDTASACFVRCSHRLDLESKSRCERSSRYHSLLLSRRLFALKIRSTLPAALWSSTLSLFWVTTTSAGRPASNWKLPGTLRVRPTIGSGMSR